MWKTLWVGGVTLAMAPAAFAFDATEPIDGQLPDSRLSLEQTQPPRPIVSPGAVSDFNDIGGDLDLQMDNGAYGPQQGQWEVTISGSGQSDEDFGANTFGLTGSIGYYFTEELLLVLRQGVNLADNGSSTARGSTRVALDYHFDLDRFRPFVGVNFGGIYGDNINDSFAAGFEGGLKWYVKPQTFLFGMIEWQWLFDDAEDIEDEFDDGQWIYTVGIGFNF